MVILRGESECYMPADIALYASQWDMYVSLSSYLTEFYRNIEHYKPILQHIDGYISSLGKYIFSILKYIPLYIHLRHICSNI